MEEHGMTDGTGQGEQRPLILTLKDKKEELTKGAHHSVAGEGNSMWRGVQGDRTQHMRHIG